LDFGSIMEQHQDEGYLDDCLNAFAARLCVDQCPADHPTRDQEDDRTIQVGPALGERTG
jgi:hypothetical protein